MSKHQSNPSRGDVALMAQSLVSNGRGVRSYNSSHYNPMTSNLFTDGPKVLNIPSHDNPSDSSDSFIDLHPIQRTSPITSATQYNTNGMMNGRANHPPINVPVFDQSSSASAPSSRSSSIGPQQVPEQSNNGGSRRQVVNGSTPNLNPQVVNSNNLSNGFVNTSKSNPSPVPNITSHSSAHTAASAAPPATGHAPVDCPDDDHLGSTTPPNNTKNENPQNEPAGQRTPRTNPINRESAPINYEEAGAARNNSIFEWVKMPTIDGTDVNREPTSACVLTFAIYYELRKRGLKWSPNIVTGSTLLMQSDSEEEFGEYMLPLFQPQQQTGMFSTIARYFRTDSDSNGQESNQVVLGPQFRWSQRTESAVNPPTIGDGIAVLERPHGHYNHVIFHVLRAMIEEYDRSFRTQHPDIDMVHNTRVDPHRLRPLLRDMITQMMNGGVREGRIVGMLTFIGAIAVQCYERQMFRVIDQVLLEATRLFEELIEPWLCEHEHWSGMMRFYLRNAVLQDDILPHPGPLFSHTPTFQVINIARMPLDYQREYRRERVHADVEASNERASASASASASGASSPAASRARTSRGPSLVGAAAAAAGSDRSAAASSVEADGAEKDENDGARSPLSNSTLVIGAIGAALAATTLFLRK